MYSIINEYLLYKLIPFIANVSPFLFLIILVLYCIMYPSYKTVYLFIMYILVNISIWIEKELIAKPFYAMFGTNNILPILGLGSRPKTCPKPKLDITNSILLYLEPIIEKYIPLTFGMPSGHCQIVWTIAIYLICYLLFVNLDTITYSSVIYNFVYIFAIVSIALYISYSRVFIEKCHTIQQAIVGSVIGIISGLLIYYFENDIIYIVKYYLQRI